MVLNKHMMALAASALFIGGASFTSAKAADLGGDCCADLEERVAELEATTARKGNRKVSLTVSGQVNRSLLIWDDGTNSDAYVVDTAGPDEGTRVTFSGKATMKPGWTAGFVIELGIADAQFPTQGGDEGLGGENFIETRLANWYIEGERTGRLTVGQQNSASDGITIISLGNVWSNAVPWYNLAFKVNVNGQNTGLIYDDVWKGIEGFKADAIRYDTPSIYGFILSAAWGEDDFWDIALRFSKEWNSIRFAAGIGYLWTGDDGNGGTFVSPDGLSTASGRQPVETEFLSGSASAMHIPTGIFVNVAGGTTNPNLVFGGRDVLDEGSYYFAQLGLERRFLSYGATTLYGEYGESDGIVDFKDSVAAPFGLGLGSLTSLNSEVTRYGFGVVQKFDAAALDLFLVYQHFETEFDGTTAAGARFSVDGDDWDSVSIGSRIKF